MVSPEQFDIYEEMEKTDYSDEKQVKKLNEMIKKYLEKKK